MINFKTPNLRAQQGMTLMGVLVSINLSVLTMLACLSLFMNHHLSAADMEESTSYNSQISHAMIVLEKEISVAGYGIPGAGVTELVINVVSATASTPGTLSVYWIYDNAGTMTCNGFRESQRTIAGKLYRSLSLIAATADCGTTSLSTATWVQSAVIAQWKITSEIASHLASNNGNILQIQSQTATCSPYGVLPPQLRLSATLSAPSFAKINDSGSSIPGPSIEICLINLS